jgi:AraC-like DNA-binding protein/quercetin dioxygenase-like cupin family protein
MKDRCSLIGEFPVIPAGGSCLRTSYNLNQVEQDGTYQFMAKHRHALDRLDIRFHWGNYSVRVLKFHLTRFKAGQVISDHKHSEYELHFIPRGKGKLILEDRQFSLHKGMLYLTGPGVLHRQEADERDPMEELCLHVDIQPLKRNRPEEALSTVDRWEEGDADECLHLLQEVPCLPYPDRFDAMACFLDAFRAWQDNEFGLPTLLKMNVIHILLRTVKTYSDKPRPAAVPSRDMTRYRCELAVQFIEDNYRRPLSLEIVAERVGISARQLQRVFREQLKVSFTEYLERYRLTRVCGDLRDSDLPVERVAGRNGFSSSHYLHYVFKKRLGTTPALYRVRSREKPILSGGEK